MSAKHPFRRVLVGAAVLAALAAVGGLPATSAHAQQGIDVVFKIDESGSMGDDIAAVQANVVTIFSALPAGSHVGLVGYGTSSHYGGTYQIPHVHTPLTADTAVFQAAVNQLIASGGLEEGYRVVYESAYDAVQVDWQGNPSPSLGFRGAPYCNILITDENPNQQYSPDSKTLQEATDAMTNFSSGQGGIFFGILPTGYFPQAQQLADDTGGQLFDLAAFRENAQPVIDAVLEACREAAFPVVLDVKPGSCPNPFNSGKMGVTPVALLGYADFDIGMIDPATVRLLGCEPLRWSYEDVATPFDGDFGDPLDENACTTALGDGYIDLTLKFDSQCLTDALAGEVGVMLWTATGVYVDAEGDEFDFEAQDVVRVMP